MKIHEARIDENLHHNGPPLDETAGLVTRLLANKTAWASLGVSALVDGLKNNQLQMVASDIHGAPNALQAWFSSCSSMMLRMLHDTWFQPLHNLAPSLDETVLDRLEEFLENSGCDPLLRDANGVDCIDLACLHGRYNSLQRWNSKGIDLAIDSRRLFLPNTPDGQWYGPLHLAANAGSVEQMKALVRGGADINFPDPSGKTALFHAKNANTATWLLENGADPGHLDHQGIDARVHWQSGSWHSQRAGELVSCLSRTPSALTGDRAVPAFVVLAYKQPTTRLKSEICRMKVSYDAVHEGHSLLGHAALRVIGHAGNKGQAAERWMEWLLEQKQARSSVNDVDLGLLCLVHRVGPVLEDPQDENSPAARVLRLAHKSSRSVAECIGMAMERYPFAAPIYLLKHAHYLERFIADGSPECVAVVDGAFNCVAAHYSARPSLSLEWFSEKVDQHRNNGAWKTSQALETLFILSQEQVRKLGSEVSPDPIVKQTQRLFTGLLERGARVNSDTELRARIDSFAHRAARNNAERAVEISQALMATYDATVLSDVVGPAQPSSGGLRF